MPPLDFTKMHGLGNDFIVVDNRDGQFPLVRDVVRALADRHTGIGFDQLLVVEGPSVAGVEFDYRIFNADGGEVEHCGNGARCFARYVTDRGLTASRRIPVNTCAGRLVLEVRDDGQVTVEMGVPNFVPAEVPFLAAANPTRCVTGEAPRPVPAGLVTLPMEDTRRVTPLMHEIDVDGERIMLGVVAIGNPHAVVLVDDVDTCPIDRLGPVIESHPCFPKRVNAGFMQIVDRRRARLRVFERGVGETRACGSGACAAHAVGVMLERLDRTATVSLSGGDLELSWPDTNTTIAMTGPCSTVFEGTTRLSPCQQTTTTNRNA